MLTLAFSGTEKAIQDWGLTNPKLIKTSQDRTEFELTVPGAAGILTSALIGFEVAITIYRNRTGSGTTWTGGEIIFQGRQVNRRSSAQTSAPLNVLRFADAWYDLENLVFQQYWTYGNPPVKRYFSRLNLFQLYFQPQAITSMVNGVGIVTITISSTAQLNNGDDVVVFAIPDLGLANQIFPVTITSGTTLTIPTQLTGTYGGTGGYLWAVTQLQTNGQQIQEIINFAASAGVNIQVGTVDLNWQLPVYPVRGVSCASAIQICLKATPDACHWIDYSTSPPSFNCRQRANLTDLSLPFADGAKHMSTEIVPRYDLQPESVVLQYQRTDTISGVPVNNFSIDAYPALSTGLAVRAMVVPIDLRGAVATEISVMVNSTAIPTTTLGGQTIPTNAWWTQKKKSLGNSDISGLTFQSGSLTVTDDAGNDYSATWQSLFANEHLDGEISSWMGKQCLTVTVAGDFIYSQTDPSTRTISRIKANKPHRVQVRVKLTNSGPGQVTYQTLQSYSSGETAPTGLAQNIYTALSVLQHEGEHSIVDQGFDTTSLIPGPQYRLNLTGGLSEWTTMQATIQKVELDFFRHTCNVSFGTVRHLAPGDLEELLQFWRYRFVYDNPALRNGGNPSQGNPQLGGQPAKENTEHANPAEAFKVLQDVAPGMVSPGTTFISHDAPNQQIEVKVVDTGGAIVTGQPYIRAALSDAVSGSSVNQSVFIQEWNVCVPDGSGGFLQKKALFMSSAPY